MDGYLLVDKPKGWTSHDVVGVVRSRTKEKKVGHAGTLDPMAEGLLVVLVGGYTKKSDQLLQVDKAYFGEMTLGIQTDSYDADGKILSQQTNWTSLTQNQTEEAMLHFKGKIFQTPPAFSAVKINGSKLYELARKGVVIEAPPKQVCVYEWQVIDFHLPQVTFNARVSKGTYIRSLVHDLGQKLGCGAMLSALRRTEVGSFAVDQAICAQTIKEMSASEIQDRLLK